MQYIAMPHFTCTSLIMWLLIVISFWASILQQKWPAEKLESFLQNVSREGMKPLIRLLHHAARLEKESDDVIQESTKESEKREVEMHMHVPDGLPKTPEEKRGVEMHRHVPDGLPKTPEEIEEENQGLMPESDFTRLIKSLRVYPSWYRERPDVETAWFENVYTIKPCLLWG